MRSATRYSEGDDIVEGESQYDPCCGCCVSGIDLSHTHRIQSHLTTGGKQR